MKFPTKILIIAISFLCQNLFAQTDPYPPSKTPDRVILSWSKDPATTQSVTWRTDVSVKNAWGQIAIADGSPDFTLNVDTVAAKTELLVTDKNAANFHSVTFENLQPDQKYLYRVGSRDDWSEWFQFETASDTIAPFSFAYFGDAQNNLKSMWSRCVRQAYTTMPDIDFMIHAGDLVNIAHFDSEWGEWFYASGWITGMKSQMACPGNHEYTRDENGQRIVSKHWKPSFTFPENGPQNLSESVYYYDYQGVRFIFLNTMSMKAYPEQMEEQAEWIRKVLEDNPNRWTIVTQHHPIYSTAFRRDNEFIRKTFQPIYEEFGVDLVLQGHDHTYGRGYNLSMGKKKKQKGTIYVVSVSGPKMYNLSFTEWLERVASNTQLFQLIHLDGNNLRFEAYTATGELYDAFELEKQEDGSNKFIEAAPENVPEVTTIPSRYEKIMNEEQIDAYKKRFETYKKRRENAKEK